MMCQNQSALTFRCYDCIQARTTYSKKSNNANGKSIAQKLLFYFYMSVRVTQIRKNEN